MKIYLFEKSDVLKLIPEYNPFTFSDWNDNLDELPEEAYKLINIAISKDTVFTEFNFMLCFNLQDSETSNKNYVMFIPDEKFNIK